MEIIHIHHPHDFKPDHFEQMVMALGFFDGVHRGHQQVIGTALDIAKEKGIKSSVMTFDPHPSVVLRRDIEQVDYITPLEEKAKLIAKLNIDYLFVVHFTHEFANLLPQEFVDQYLIDLHVVHVVAGFDYTYGRMGKGTMETLMFHSRGKFQFTTVPKLALKSDKVSSTLIRKLIKNGRLEKLPDYLGRFYTTSGTVIHGDKRGRTIGFPTANTDIHDSYLIPPNGVYAIRILVNGKWYEGVCNVGYKPTFNDEQPKKPSVEAHIFNFNEDIYGNEVVIEWHKHLRSEQKFSSVEELIAQIEKDKKSSTAYFQENKRKLSL